MPDNSKTVELIGVEARGAEIMATGRLPAGPLTRSQGKAIRAINDGKTVNEAATIAGVKPATIRAYLRTDEGALNLAYYKKGNRTGDKGESTAVATVNRGNSDAVGGSLVRKQGGAVANGWGIGAAGKVKRRDDGRLDIAKTGASLIETGLTSAVLTPKEEIQTGAALVKLSADLGLDDKAGDDTVTDEDRALAGRQVRLAVYYALISTIKRPAAARRALSGAAVALGLPNPLTDG